MLNAFIKCLKPTTVWLHLGCIIYCSASAFKDLRTQVLQGMAANWFNFQDQYQCLERLQPSNLQKSLAA